MVLSRMRFKHFSNNLNIDSEEGESMSDYQIELTDGEINGTYEWLVTYDEDGQKVIILSEVETAPISPCITCGYTYCGCWR